VPHDEEMNVGLFRRGERAGAGPQDTAATPGTDDGTESASGVDGTGVARGAEGAVGTDGVDGADVVGGADGAAEPRTAGPFDVSTVDDTEGRLDLGSVLLPGVPGMGLRLEVDRKTGKFTGVACAVEGSVLQVQAFAAPRTEGIWDEIRAEIEQSVGQQGGSADDVPGPFGRELLARLPAAAQDGRTSFRPARFLGVDGPRWFLRGVITGQAAVDPEAATTLEFVFANTVVVRGDQARPPRDVLELRAPAQPDENEPEPAARPSFDPLERGPEITEIH
jgi:hypothetical protein